MKRFALTLVMLAIIGDAHGACTHADGRVNLKKWGLAYCIATHVDGRAAQGGSAMGGYFQFGGHNSEEAYQHVRSFFDERVARHPARAKVSGTDLSLMTCVNAYESTEYRQLIRKQDKYLPGVTVEP